FHRGAAGGGTRRHRGGLGLGLRAVPVPAAAGAHRRRRCRARGDHPGAGGEPGRRCGAARAVPRPALRSVPAHRAGGAAMTLRCGDLLVHRWPAARPDAPVAVAAHGITANGLSFGRVAAALGGQVTLAAPDLRGRAGSRDAPGPYGIARHAADLVAVLDTLGVPEAVLVGHSMGAWVAAVAAARHPSRVSGVVLVDGGLAFPPPPDLDLDAALAAVIGPAIA